MGAAGHRHWAKTPDGTRIYAIGDIHGRLDLLDELQRMIRADAAAADRRLVVVYLGDYIDRGPSSREVIDRMLDDPLSDYVDHTPRARDMTLRQLANHTSGIPPELDGSLYDASPAAEIDAFVQRGELAFEPGTDYGYSRVGYYLLALALERASGTI